MNEKLKSILRTAWAEPRHFFFWLAFFSLVALICIAAAAGFAGPPRVLAYFALLCALCFVVAVAAFVLGWIPPVRRLLSWLLGRRFLALASIITLVALFYAVENWRGRSAWQNFKRGREAQGERFDFAELTPRPVPADQNFFESPLWNDLHFTQTKAGVTWSDTNWGNHVIFNVFGPQGANSPTTGGWPKAQHVDLAAWQTFYRGTNNLFEAKNGAPTNYFPIAAEPQTPAADVLLALSKFKENRELLRAASSRPHARFWINWDAGPAMLLPHLARLKATSQYLSLHATAALKAGDKATAMEDLQMLFRLMDSVREEPILISHLVRLAVEQIALQTIWEGLADRQWSEADLTLLQSELGHLDFLADYKTAMVGEKACNLWVVDYIRKSGLTGWNELVSTEHEASSRGDVEKFLTGATFELIPGGWFDQNKLSLCRFHEQYILPAANEQQHRIDPVKVRQSEAAVSKRSSSPYDILRKLYLPAYGKAAERFARGQSSVDLARTACALERYRLAKGQFPETLDLLAPQFIEKLPPDVITGAPLKYHRNADGNFTLYSVGWNETDDGGKTVATKQGSPDPDRGDWVWQYTKETAG
ncbi:MAG TPA: hypothetical protein VL361_01765 [Candidatus Limnocylindrales bacterium]|nr:hypothetical protein [Candidatus Limnocylindrales bacterium]